VERPPLGAACGWIACLEKSPPGRGQGDDRGRTRDPHLVALAISASACIRAGALLMASPARANGTWRDPVTQSSASLATSSAGLAGETEQAEAASCALMERLTSMSPKVYMYSHTFLPLPGTSLQVAPPGSVGRTTRAVCTCLAQRGREWGQWQQQETLAQLIREFRHRPGGDR
jgi:hypothetical protein